MLRIYRWIFEFFCLLLALIPGLSVSGQVEAPNWQQLTSEFAGQSIFSNAVVSVELVRLKDEKQMVSWQPELASPPASTIKVLYTLAAIDQFGPDFSFETRFSFSGELIPDGSLEGDLIVDASGDPSLGSDRFGKTRDLENLFRAMYEKLQKAGIHCVDGDLVLVLPYQSYPVSGHWPMEDPGNYYGAGDWGFNFHENLVDVTLNRSKKVGYPCFVSSIQPEIPGMHLSSEVQTAGPGSGDEAYIFGNPFQYRRVIQGTIPAGSGPFDIQGSMPDPPYNFLQLLQQYLDRRGIYTQHLRVTTSYQGARKKLGTIRSVPLLTLAKACNDHSINLYSEALGKLLLSRQLQVMPRAYPSEEQWESLFRSYGMVPRDIRIQDACGLSPFNLISPVVLNRFLIAMTGKLGLQRVLDLLPANGKDGAARDFLKGKGSEQLWFKSGYIQGVLNYTGIYRSLVDQQYYVFTIFTNHNQSNTKEVKKQIVHYLQALINTPA